MTSPDKASPEFAAPPVPEVDLRELMRVVMKHGRLIALVTAWVLGLSLLYCLLAPKTWQAEVTIKIPDGGSSSDSLKQLTVLADSSNDPIETYQQIAQSVNVGTRVALAVSLTAQDEYANCNGDLEKAAAKLLEHVTVANIKRSNLLSIKVQAKDPVFVAKLANTWAQAFIDANLDFSRSGAHSRRVFIEGQLVEVKERLVQGEDGMRRFSESSGRVSGLGAAGSDGATLLIKLQDRITTLTIERATVVERYSPDHPHRKEVEASLKEAQSEYNRALAALPKTELAFARLSREVKVDETVYNLLLERLQEARLAENVDESGIVVVDQALVPRIPVWPKSLLVLVGAVFVGLMLGVVSAWAVETIRDEVGGEDELARQTRLPVLGLVPDWRSEGQSAPEHGRHDPSYLVSAPRFRHTFYSESFKQLRTNINYAQLNHDIKALAVLSPGSEEGKTLANANLALTLAQSGKKVCLIDADLRKPSVHKVFGVKPTAQQGLPLLLSGQGQAGGMLVKGPVPGLWLLPCGVKPPNPSELLGSPRLGYWLKWLKSRYDYVIFDAAPILPVTDSVALSTQLDGVLLLARFEQTRRSEVQRSLDVLGRVNARVLGTVLNSVDMKKYAYTYGYGRRYYAYGQGKD